MAKTKISQYDATAGNNTDIDSISIAEGMAPSDVNNAIRELMAHLKDMDAGTQALTSPQLTSVDINGGSIDGAVIGANSAAAITGTTITGTSLVIGDANINENDFESIDGITAGTVAASKAVIVDTNKDITGFRNVTLTGELDAGSLDISGNIDVDGTTNLDVVDIDGAVDFASTTAHAGNATFADNAKAIFGAGSDLEIYHDGNDSIIRDVGEGDLILRGSTGIKLQSASGALEYLSTNSSTGAVELKLSGATKLATTSTGIDVTGIITTDGMTTSAVIKAPDGSAAAPAYTNFGDADGGMYFPSANQVSFASGGVQRLNINNQGDIYFYEDTGSTPKLQWSASAESLGIGTSPTSALHVINSNDTGEGIATFEASSTKNGYVYINADANRRKSLVFQSAGVDKFSMGVGDSDELSESSFFIGNGKTGGSGANLVIDSTGNVGISTSLPDKAIHLKTAVNNTAVVRIESTATDSYPTLSLKNDAREYQLTAHGPLGDKFTIYDGTAGSHRLVIDSSGNVQIGDTSPENILHVKGAANTSTTVQIESATSGYSPKILFDGIVGSAADNLLGEVGASWDTHTNKVAAIRFESGSDTTNKDDGLISFWTSDAGSTLDERMRISNLGNVGIGTSSGVRKLEIAGNNNGGAKANYIRITDTDTSATAGNQQGGIEFYTSDSGNENVTASIENLYAGTGAGSELTFNTAPNGSSGVSEGFRLDENGNLLVGATAESNWETVAGFRTRPSGSTTITRSASPVLYANRLTSHGDIMEFRKDGTAVGSIGSSSSQMYIGYSDTGIRFTATADDIRPWNPSTGVIRDAAIDLGDSAGRFKDLYLSGGVVFDAVAGNATSNTLDDYEEGTWTVEMYDALSGGNASSTQVTGRYTKIGEQVTASFDAFNNVSTSGLTSGNTVYFTLPFAASTTGRACGSCHLDTITFPTGTTMITPTVSDSNSRAQLYASGSAAQDSTIKVSSFDGTSSDVVNFTLSYRTAS